MQLVVLEDSDAVVSVAAEHIAMFVRMNPSPRLGLATGKTQEGVYQALVEEHLSQRLSFAESRFFMLDEYLGVDPLSSESFQGQLRRTFLDKVNVPHDSLETLDGNAQDIAAESARFESAVVEFGGIDLQLLGIGTNGHIGFNEPGSSFDSRTRAVDLFPETLERNFPEMTSLKTVPRRAISQGLATIAEAGSILLLATGKAKAQAIAAMVSGPLSEKCPASILQLHKSLKVILDEDAASLLNPHLATS